MAVTADYTPALFNYYLSGTDDAIEDGTGGMVGDLWTETAVIDGVTWTKTHEDAVQSAAGTATDIHVISNSIGFSATGVELVNYSGPNPIDWDIFDNSEWVSETWTGDFGNFVVAFSDGENIDTFTGTMTTVSGDLLENVNIVITFEGDSDFPSSLNGTATLNGETVTFDSSMLGEPPVTEEPPVEVDYTPALFNYYLSGTDDAIEDGTGGMVGDLWTETAVIDGVTWTKTHEDAVQSAAGTATDIHVISNSIGFSATGVELVNYSGPNPIDWDIFDNSEWVSETWTGDFGNFVVAFSDGENIDTFTGTMTTVSGDLLENVNIVITFEGDSDFPSSLNGTATLNGETVTFDSSMLGEPPVFDSAIQIIEENDVIYIVANDANGSQVLKQEVDTKTGYSVDAVELQDNGTGGSYTDSVTDITWTQTWDSNTNTTTTTNDATDYSRTEIGDNNGTEIITSTTGENYVITNDTVNDTQNIKGLFQVGAAIFDIDFTFSTTDYSTISATWSATTDYVTPTNNLPSWTDEAGVVHTETVTEVDNILTVKETTTLGFDLTYTVNTTTGDSTITGTYVASDGTTFTNVSAQATFNPAGDNGDGDLENATGTAIASTGESATFVSNSTNNGFVITYTDSSNAVRVLTATDDAVMVSNITTPEAPANAAPVTVGTIEHLDIELGESVTLNPDDYFTDADGDALTYTATVDADAPEPWADFVGGPSDPSAIGDHTIVITADDGKGGTATQSFTATVNAATVTNTAPVAVGTMDDTSVDVGQDTPQLDPTNYFTDADNDTLSYTVTSARLDGSDAETDTLTEWNSWIDDPLLADDAGDWDITITADDGKGGTATQSFTMTVNAATVTNTAPVAVGTMDDTSVDVGQDTPQLDPTNYFTDADNDTLSYTVTSARLDGSDAETDTLTEWNSWIDDPLLADDAGDWDITITADDGKGGTATQSFTMTVNAASAPVENSIEGIVHDSSVISDSREGEHEFTLSYNDSNGDAQTVSFTVNAPAIIENNHKDANDNFTYTDINGVTHTESDTSNTSTFSGGNYGDNMTRFIESSLGTDVLINVPFVSAGPDFNNASISGKYVLSDGTEFNIQTSTIYQSDFATDEQGEHSIAFDAEGVDQNGNSAVAHAENGPDIGSVIITDKDTGVKTVKIFTSVDNIVVKTITFDDIQSLNLPVTNTAPVAVNDTETVDEDSNNNSIDVLTNDTDADNDVLSVIDDNTLTATHGSVSVNTDGTLNYTPETNNNSKAIINYTVSDNNGGTGIGEVLVNVSDINDSPTGSVTISGGATSGETLTASNDLADVDGLGAITYTWTDGTNTLGTGGTYTLTDAEVGKTISVTASYTDGDKTNEMVSSSATAQVEEYPVADITYEYLTEKGTVYGDDGQLHEVDFAEVITKGTALDDDGQLYEVEITVFAHSFKVGQTVVFETGFDGAKDAFVFTDTATGDSFSVTSLQDQAGVELESSRWPTTDQPNTQIDDYGVTWTQSLINADPANPTQGSWETTNDSDDTYYHIESGYVDGVFVDGAGHVTSSLGDNFQRYFEDITTSAGTKTDAEWLAIIASEGVGGNDATINDAPQKVGTINNFEVPAETANLTLPFNPNDYFSDLDGDTLSFYIYHMGRRDGHDGPDHVEDVNVTSSLESLSSFLSDGTVGVPVGTASFEMVAVDSSGARSTQPFTITVNAAPVTNTAPEAVGTIEHLDIELGESVTLDPDDYFTDADGDALTYTATVSADAPEPWANFVGGPSDPSAIGDHTIVITADDGKGGTATQSFTATVNAASENGHFIYVEYGSDSTDNENGVEFGTYAYDSNTEKADFTAVFDDSNPSSGLANTDSDAAGFTIKNNTDGSLYMSPNGGEDAADIANFTDVSARTKLYSLPGNEEGAPYFTLIENETQDTAGVIKGNFVYMEYVAGKVGTPDGIQNGGETGSYELDTTTGKMTISGRLNDSVDGTPDDSGLFNAGHAEHGLVAVFQDHSLWLKTGIPGEDFAFILNEIDLGDSAIQGVYGSSTATSDNYLMMFKTADTTNTAPTISNTIADQVYTLGDTIIDPNDYFADTAGDTLDFYIRYTSDGVIDPFHFSGMDGTTTFDKEEVTLIAMDKAGNTVEQTFNLTINATPVTNTAPVAINDTAITDEDTSVTIDVLANDTDADGDTLSVVDDASLTATNGAVTVNADGTLNYTPNADYNGTDTITYTVSDGNGGTDTATVAVTVNPQNEVTVTEYSVAAGEINPGEPAYDVVKTKTYSDDGSVLLSIHKVETYVTGQVVTSDTVYNLDGSSTFHKTEVRDNGTLSKDIVIDVDGNRVIAKYELDGTTLKGTIEITPSTVSGVEETRVYKDADGNVTNTTTLTITTGTDQAGNPVDIYTDIVDATGAVRVHEANGETNFWGVDHDTHNHQFYGAGDNKVFITETVDANGDTSVTYSNKYGYSENINVNDAPVINNAIADVIVSEGDSYPTFDPDALGWFSDADGDNLTYTFHWPEDAADDVETLAEFNNGNALEVMPVGEEVVHVTATDPSGASVTQTMKFVVNEPAPTAQLIQIRDAGSITKSQISIDEYGADYTGGDTNKLMKFELWIDATELSSFGIGATEIRGYQFDMDWNPAEIGALNFGHGMFASDVNIGFNPSNIANSGITFNSETGAVAIASSGAIVDTDPDNNLAFNGNIQAEKMIGTFYVNPDVNLEVVGLSVNGMVVVTDVDNIIPSDYSVQMEVSSINATVQTDATNYLDNVTLNYFKDGMDTGVSTLVEGGDISFDQALDFDAVKLSNPSAYNDTSSIQADDAVDILRHIVELDSLADGSIYWHAADIDNDGQIAADDAVDILRHIVELDTIDTFDLIDNATGNRITTLDPDAAEGQWTIVTNGDVDGSGSFNDGYTVAMDIV